MKTEEVVNKILDEIQEEFDHGIQVWERSNNKNSRLQGVGHANCAAILLAKLGRDDTNRSKKMVEVFTKVLEME